MQGARYGPLPGTGKDPNRVQHKIFKNRLCILKMINLLKMFPALRQLNGHIVSIKSVKTKTSDVQHQVTRRICKNLHILLLDVSIFGFSTSSRKGLVRCGVLQTFLAINVAFTFFCLLHIHNIYLNMLCKENSLNLNLKKSSGTCSFLIKTTQLVITW